MSSVVPDPFRNQVLQFTTLTAKQFFSPSCGSQFTKVTENWKLSFPLGEVGDKAKGEGVEKKVRMEGRDGEDFQRPPNRSLKP